MSWCYAALAAQLGRDTPIYGLQARGLADDRPLPRYFDEVVAECLDHVRRVQTSGPYQLLGFSFGGNLAHAVATRLEKEGEKVNLLAIMDSYPGLPAHSSDELTEREALALTLEEIGYRGPVRGTDPIPWNAIRDFLRSQGNPMGNFETPLLEAINRIHLNNARLAEQYRPSRFSGTIVHFRAKRGDGSELPDSWHPYVGGIVQYEIDCSHVEMTTPGPLAEIGRRLQCFLHTTTVKDGGSAGVDDLPAGLSRQSSVPGRADRDVGAAP